MPTTTHTPGPWHVETSIPGAVEIMDANGLIASTEGFRGSEAEEHANAALIAAAPEMAAALEHVAALAGTALLHAASLDKQGMLELHEQIRAASMAAIAKATATPAPREPSKAENDGHDEAEIYGLED